MSLRTGFIGLGNIGKPMAINLANSDFPLIVYDIFDAACDELAALGATKGKNPADVAAHAEVIGVCVRDDSDTVEVLTGKHGILNTAAPGTIVAIHSTVRPETIYKLAAIAAEKSVHVIDAPITGGAHGAAAKKLCYMVGADEETFNRVKPVLETSGEKVILAGPAGSGMKLKLCNNLMTYLELLAVHEGMKLAQKGGLSLKVLKEVTTANGVLTPSMQMFFDTKKGFDDETFAKIMAGFKAVAVKDLSIALEFADSLDIALPGAGVCREAIKQAYGSNG